MYSTHFKGKDISNVDVPYPDPVELMQWWLPPVTEEDIERPVMALATQGKEGYPDIRHVLASTCDESGISFHTGLKTEKSKELAENGKAAITIVWPEERKQLIVQGDVSKQSYEKALETYRERPRYLQLLAHVNTEEVSHKPTKERAKIWADFISEHPEGTELSPPKTWVGYTLKPNRISFWRATDDAPSIRHDYYLQPNGEWEVKIIPG